MHRHNLWCSSRRGGERWAGVALAVTAAAGTCLGQNIVPNPSFEGPYAGHHPAGTVGSVFPGDLPGWNAPFTFAFPQFVSLGHAYYTGTHGVGAVRLLDAIWPVNMMYGAATSSPPASLWMIAVTCAATPDAVPFPHTLGFDFITTGEWTQAFLPMTHTVVLAPNAPVWVARAAAFACPPPGATPPVVGFWTPSGQDVLVDDTYLFPLSTTTIGPAAGYALQTGSTGSGGVSDLQLVDSQEMSIESSAGQNWSRLMFGSYVASATATPSTFVVNITARRDAAQGAVKPAIEVFDWVNQKWVRYDAYLSKPLQVALPPVPVVSTTYSADLLHTMGKPMGPWQNFVTTIPGTPATNAVLARLVLMPAAPGAAPFKVYVDEAEVVKTP